MNEREYRFTFNHSLLKFYVFFRAWYGLGQTYELLNLFQYAVHYHIKAANLRFSSLFLNYIILKVKFQPILKIDFESFL